MDNQLYLSLPDFIDAAWLETVRVFKEKTEGKEAAFKQIFIAIIKEEHEKQNKKAALAKDGHLEKMLDMNDPINQRYVEIYKNKTNNVIAYSKTGNIVSKCIREALIKTGISSNGLVPEFIDNNKKFPTYPVKMTEVPINTKIEDLLVSNLEMVK